MKRRNVATFPVLSEWFIVKQLGAFMAYDWAYFWYKFKNSGPIKFLKAVVLVCLLFGATFLICFFITQHNLPFVGLRNLDMTYAPQKLIIRQGTWHKDVLRDSMEFVCLNETFSGGRGGRTSRVFRVLLKTTNGRFESVSRGYRAFGVSTNSEAGNAKVAALHAEAGEEAKRIADAYNLPMGVCN